VRWGTNLQANSLGNLIVNGNSNSFADLNAHGDSVTNGAIKSLCQFRCDYSEVQRLLCVIHASSLFTFKDFVLHGSADDSI
jgi:hypothetical protein